MHDAVAVCLFSCGVTLFFSHKLLILFFQKNITVYGIKYFPEIVSKQLTVVLV